MYTLLIALIYLAFISLGLPDSLLGAAWPVMSGELSVPVSYMGIISMVISGSTIISSLFSDRLVRRIGTQYLVIISTLLTAVALFGFSVSARLWQLVLLSVPYGLGAGAIDAALNNYVATHYTSRHMSWLHCFWGAGAIISPFIMGYSLAHASWSAGYRAVGFVQLGIALVLIAFLPAWRGGEKQQIEESRAVGIRGVLRLKGVRAVLIAFFAYCAAEAAAMYWASTYLVEQIGMASEAAARLGSMFYIGITAGRFLGGFIMNRVGDKRMIRIGAAVLCGGILLLAIPYGSVTPILGFVVIGFGCAPIYPCIVHLAPESFGAENSGAVIGVEMACAYVGTTVAPPIFGLISQALGFWVLPLFLAVFILAMVISLEASFRAVAKAKDKSGDKAPL